MKSFYSTLILLLCVSFSILYAQTPARLTVTIQSPKENDQPVLSVPVFWYILPESHTTLTQTAPGQFSAVLAVDRPRLVYLQFRGQWLKLYAEPGKSMAITIDGKAPAQPAQFAEPLARENTLLQQLGYTSYNMMPDPMVKRPSSLSGLHELAAQLNREKKQQLDRCRDSRQQDRFNWAFYHILEGEIRYKPVIDITNKGIFGIQGASVYDVSESVKNVFGDEVISDDRFIDSDMYFFSTIHMQLSQNIRCGADTNCYQKLTREIYNTTTDQEIQEKYSLFGQLFSKIHEADYFLTGATREKAMALLIHSFKDDFLYLRPAYDLYLKRNPQGKHQQLIEKDLAPFFAFEKKSPAASETRFTDTHTPVKTMADLLKAHKGKVVYVDFWGSWCGPCRQEMPHAAMLKEKMKGKPVDFLYIAYENGIDETHVKRWKSAIDKLKITGTHFLADHSFMEQLKKDKMEVGQFPTYALFDKQGKLIKFGASAPSDQALLQELEQAMK
ncbi:TlpA family protein disulfide reductase [Arsenicibacter rosenii]|uniref:Thioredoxin domain-containing protein n=1 Tax=Arsenicibacter rosenii TaxID=1750698 RepID=A0A1S2VFN6_9BACT|nr:TlpA family protein disulfide reductase [Arsenicibacter rosenii]OIN57524.1 hypothetical protein BLX24_18715 [Arsenicibacter rosenii]